MAFGSHCTGLGFAFFVERGCLGKHCLELRFISDESRLTWRGSFVYAQAWNWVAFEVGFPYFTSCRAVDNNFGGERCPLFAFNVNARHSGGSLMIPERRCKSGCWMSRQFWFRFIVYAGSRIETSFSCTFLLLVAVATGLFVLPTESNIENRNVRARISFQCAERLICLTNALQLPKAWEMLKKYPCLFLNKNLVIIVLFS